MGDSTQFSWPHLPLAGRKTLLSQHSEGKLVYFAIVHFSIKLLELPSILRIALYMTFRVFCPSIDPGPLNNVRSNFQKPCDSLTFLHKVIFISEAV